MQPLGLFQIDLNRIDREIAPLRRRADEARLAPYQSSSLRSSR